MFKIEIQNVGDRLYGASVDGAEPELGASPDEALGAAVRQLILETCSNRLTIDVQLLAE
jgi:hypothetical protein